MTQLDLSSSIALFVTVSIITTIVIILLYLLIIKIYEKCFSKTSLKWFKTSMLSNYILQNKDCFLCHQNNPNASTLCQHFFHFQCIQEWLKSNNNNCPECRNVKSQCIYIFCTQCFERATIVKLPFKQNLQSTVEYSSFCDQKYNRVERNRIKLNQWSIKCHKCKNSQSEIQKSLSSRRSQKNKKYLLNSQIYPNQLSAKQRASYYKRNRRKHYDKTKKLQQFWKQNSLRKQQIKVNEKQCQNQNQISIQNENENKQNQQCYQSHCNIIKLKQTNLNSDYEGRNQGNISNASCKNDDNYQKIQQS